MAGNEAGEVEGMDHIRIYSEGNMETPEKHDKIYILKMFFILAAVWWMDFPMETSKDTVEARSSGGLN